MKRFLILFFLLSAFCLLMLSCASNWTKNNGGFAQDDDIKTMFETHEGVPDYNYFYTFSLKFSNRPEAIVGIKKDYELVKISGWINVTNWQQFESGGEKLKELVEAMYNPTSYGYIIYAPGGDQIGVMYSQKWPPVWVPEVRLKNGNQLEVTPHKYNSTWAPAAG